MERDKPVRDKKDQEEEEEEEEDRQVRQEEEEEEVIEWVDHSNATALEEFVSELEQVFLRWSERHSQSSVQSAELQLGRDTYSFLLVEGEGLADLHPKASEEAVLDLESRLSSVELEILQWRPEGTLHREGWERRWFGVDRYVIMSPTQRSGNLNDVSLLLSSASLALSVEGCSPMPCFVTIPQSPKHGLTAGLKRLRRKRRRKRRSHPAEDIYGVCLSGMDSTGTTIHLNATVKERSQVKEKHQTLSGLMQLFKRKVFKEDKFEAPERNPGELRWHTESPAEQKTRDLIDLKEGNILASVVYSFFDRALNKEGLLLADVREEAYLRALQWSDWLDDDVSWRLHVAGDTYSNKVLQALQGGPDQPPLWGPLRDPVQRMDLQILWTSFKESTYAENSLFSSLVPEAAPKWILHVPTPMETSDARKQPGSRKENVAQPRIDDKKDEAGYGNDKDDDGEGDEENNEQEADGYDEEDLGEHGNDANSEVDIDTSSWVCPLWKIVWYVFQLHEAAQSSMYKDALLSNVLKDGAVSRRNGSSLSEDLAVDLDAERLRASNLVKELFTPLPSTELRNADLEQIRNLKRLYMEGGLAHAEFIEAMQRIVEDSKKDIPAEFDGELRNGEHRPCHRSEKFNVLSRPCPQCWICSSASLSYTPKESPRKLKTAPVGSLLSKLVIRAIPHFGASIEGFAQLWCSFVHELRWHWDHLVLIPIDAGQDQLDDSPGLAPVDHTEGILQQKLRLLNLCIATEAHARFDHDTQSALEGQRRGGQSPGSDVHAANMRDDGEEEENEDEDEFFDAASVGDEDTNASTSPKKNRKPFTQFAAVIQGIQDPWTIENAMMTEDMVLERNQLLESLALNSETAGLHEKMLSDSLRSEMCAFKAVNPNKAFEDFKRWKGRTRRIGEYWRKLWNECEASPVKLQLKQSPQLFNAAAEAEKALLDLETMPPSELLHELLGIAMESAEFVLSNAVGNIAVFPDIYSSLKREVLSVRSQIDQLYGDKPGVASTISPPVSPRGMPLGGKTEQEMSIARIQNTIALDGLRRTEFLLSMSVSLLHKLPSALVVSLLAEEQVSGGFVCSLSASDKAERRHVRALLFPESKHDSFSIPDPDEKEYLFRCLAARPSFTPSRLNHLPKFSSPTEQVGMHEANVQAHRKDEARGSFDQVSEGESETSQDEDTRLGVNRMYVCLSRDQVVLATALTESAFV